MKTLAKLYDENIQLLDLLGGFVRHAGEVWKVNGVDLTSGVLTLKKFQAQTIAETTREHVQLIQP